MTEARQRILIVEDESKIAGVLLDYLAQADYDTHHLTRGDEVEPWLDKHPVDLVLLDLMLPGKNGLDICKALRAGTPGRAAPAIIMVTARVEEIDRLLGLELGADDYICKPFSPREVVARIKAVLRRGTHTAPSASEELPGGLTMEDGAWRATIAGHAARGSAPRRRRGSTDLGRHRAGRAPRGPAPPDRAALPSGRLARQRERRLRAGPGHCAGHR